MRQRETIFSAWKSYEHNVVPADAPLVQREECRRAFYAGAAACLSIASNTAECETEEESVAELHALHDEIQSITSDLRET